MCQTGPLQSLSRMLLHGPPRACSLVSDPTGLKAQPWAPCGQAPHPSGPITSISKTTIRSAPSGLRSSGGPFCSCSPVLPSGHPSPRLQLLLFPGMLRALRVPCSPASGHSEPSSQRPHRNKACSERGVVWFPGGELTGPGGHTAL